MEVPGESKRKVTSVLPHSAPNGTLLQLPCGFKVRLEANPKRPKRSIVAPEDLLSQPNLLIAKEK